MKTNDVLDFYSEKYEIEIDDELIEKLIKGRFWGRKHINELKDMAKNGAKWNTKRNTVVFPAEFF